MLLGPSSMAWIPPGWVSAAMANADAYGVHKLLLLSGGGSSCFEAPLKELAADLRADGRTEDASDVESLVGL
eukprot:4858854-Alexandrium_andersonii.AAC.1